jgi:hypothetical protein
MSEQKSGPTNLDLMKMDISASTIRLALDTKSNPLSFWKTDPRQSVLTCASEKSATARRIGGAV